MTETREELRALAGDCVHCGFCLPACPTYQLWGEEMDSPRGRIHLMAQMLDGTAGTQAVSQHLDRCLGCMACVPACPSGVRYDRLIEGARTWSEDPAADSPRLPPRSARERAVRAAIYAVFPYPRRLRLAAGPLRAAQRTGLTRQLAGPRLARLFPELTAATRLAPPRRRRTGPAVPERIPADGPRRAVVGLLAGCVQRVFFPHVNAATARVLAAEGCDVIVPPGQGCCGALPLHGGRSAQATRLARAMIETFERAGVDQVIVNVAGCGSAMKDYATLLAADPAFSGRAAALSAKVRDLTEFLAEIGPRAPRSPLRATVAYQDACHLAHAQRVTKAPRQLLGGIPELRVAEIGDGATCCGSAGVYNLVQPGPAAELGARKATAVLATGAEMVVSANPGCMMQIAAALTDAGHRLPIAHIAEVLDASIRGLPPDTLRPAMGGTS